MNLTNISLKFHFNMIASDFRVFLYQHDEKKEVGMKQILKEPTREVGDDIY